MKVKRKIRLPRIVILVLYAIFNYVILWSATYQHELVHRQIYQNFGVDSNVSVNPLTLGGSTQAFSRVDEEDRRVVESLHSLNEIMGYQNGVIISMLTMIGLLQVSQLMRKE